MAFQNLTLQVIKPGARQVSLNFLALNDSHFSTYTITARNDHGQNEYDITLHQLTPSGVREDALGGNKGNRQNKQKDAKYFIAQSEVIQNQGKYSVIYVIKFIQLRFHTNPEHE